MANAYGSTVWTLDTAGAIFPSAIKIKKMVWVPNAAGDDLAVDEADGGEIWTVTDALTGGVAGKEEIDFAEGKWFDGLTLTTIGGGKLYVYFV